MLNESSSSTGSDIPPEPKSSPPVVLEESFRASSPASDVTCASIISDDTQRSFSSSSGGSEHRSKRFKRSREPGSQYVSRSTLLRWVEDTAPEHEHDTSNISSAEPYHQSSPNLLESQASVEVGASLADIHEDTPNDILSISDESDGSSFEDAASSSVCGSLSIISSLSSSDSDYSDMEQAERDSVDSLFDGSPLTTDEAVSGLMDLYLKERWTKKSLGKTLQYVKSILPQPNEMPSTLHMLFKYVQARAPPCIIKRHDYCSNCQTLQEKDAKVCNSCNQSVKINSFFEFSLESQIKFFFEHRNLAEAIDSFDMEKSPDGFICDIKDGEEIIKIRLLINGIYDLILLWNTDGLALSSSSKISAWPLFCTICNLPPHLRSAFMIVAGIWCDDKAPDMNVFLKPFVESLKQIYESGGVKWQHPKTKDDFKSQVIAPIFCGDALARAKVLNIMQFNSKYGCQTCEQKASKIDVNTSTVTKKRKKRCLIFKENPAQMRTHDRMKQQQKVSETRNKPCKGVKGNAIVTEIPFFDRSKGTCAEYLHHILLGCVKYFTVLMISVKGNWFIGDKLDHINKVIQSIKVPDYINRCPRDLSMLKHWKASEFLFWLLYYSLPALLGNLPEKYFDHWLLLVRAVFTLLQDRISRDDLERVEIMLRCFVRDVGPLYGWEYYTYNVHCLLHLVEYVKRWGPLWATSAFPFENQNGVLDDCIHGTKHFGKELVNNITIAQGIQVLKNCVKSYQKKFKDCVNTGNAKELGSAVFPVLSRTENELLDDAMFENVTYYLRASHKNIVYTSKLYDSDKRRGNSFVKFRYHTSVHYGQIKYFIKNGDGALFCFVEQFSVKHSNIIFHSESLFKINQIIPFEETGNVLTIPFCDIVTKVIKAGNFLCLRPNMFDENL